MRATTLVLPRPTRNLTRAANTDAIQFTGAGPRALPQMIAEVGVLGLGDRLAADVARPLPAPAPNLWADAREEESKG